MQIAPTHSAHSSKTSFATDIVSPSTLFRIAGSRAFSALQLLHSGEGRVPSAPTAELAIMEAAAGARLLQSVNVPSTPYNERQIATSAIRSLNAGINLLSEYASGVQSIGTSGTLPVARVSHELQGTLSEAKDMLLTAASRLAIGN